MLVLESSISTGHIVYVQCTGYDGDMSVDDHYALNAPNDGAYLSRSYLPHDQHPLSYTEISSKLAPSSLISKSVGKGAVSIRRVRSTSALCRPAKKCSQLDFVKSIGQEPFDRDARGFQKLLTPFILTFEWVDLFANCQAGASDKS
ncbi:hypothetical protein R1flu_013246 [Riccia fluitans]|uniref:Uncharacterized protein n=1 Tax=Riccia fluitans TaxID=41844 RepID=A0ABD1YD20_9MARC